jgi:hypothetical protein
MRQLRIGLTAALAVYTIAILLSQEPWSFMDNVNLPIHETGHLVFAPFGDTMMLLGGTILQLLVPLVFAAYFVTKDDEHAASIALWWVGQNCLNISSYIADAQVMELPLVGGGEHDWNLLLSQWGVLPSSTQLANLVHGFGVVLFLTALVWGAFRALDSRVRVTRATVRRGPVFARR